MSYWFIWMMRNPPNYIDLRLKLIWLKFGILILFWLTINNRELISLWSLWSKNGREGSLNYSNSRRNRLMPLSFKILWGRLGWIPKKLPSMEFCELENIYIAIIYLSLFLIYYLFFIYYYCLLIIIYYIIIVLYRAYNSSY